MEMPKVSVIVPCYNVEQYVAECLESIINQTLKEIEIICVNDGSKDGTLDILKEFAKKDERVIIIDKPNSGYGHSVNLGFQKARGKYLGIVESDDFIDPEMYEHLYHIAEVNELDVARCCYYEYHTSDGSNRKEEFHFVPKNEVFRPLDNDAPFWQQPTVWINLYNRKWLEESGIKFLETPGASYQDTSFMFKVYCKCNRFMMIRDAYLHYRVDNAGSSINSPGKVFCVCDEWNEIKKFLRENPNVRERVKFMAPILQLGNYRWNYNRLRQPNRYEFAKVWSKELREYISAGELRWERLNWCERRELFAMAFFPIHYKFRKRKMH